MSDEKQTDKELRRDTVEQRRCLVDQVLSNMSNEAVSKGLNPFMCVVIMQTFDGLAVRGVSDSRVIPMDGKMDAFLVKIQAIVEEFVDETLGTVPGKKFT